YLSPPHMSGREIAYIQEAFAENFISTAGKNLLQFEKQLTQIVGIDSAVALNSGTAAIHLALKVLNIQAGDEVLCSSFTFVATANPVLYLNAVPIFIDSEPETWNMCPQALESAIQDRLKKGKQPKAIIVVHLYGMPAKLKEILAIAQHYQIPVIEDAAEALGSTYQNKMVGTFGEIGLYSFNGNKIITTSGGGALVATNPEYTLKALFLATQGKDPAPHYQHSEVGFNYRMSNIVAGIGLGQLEVLPERVKKKRAIFAYYQESLSQYDFIQFQPELPGHYANRWLSCLVLAPGQSVTKEKIQSALAAELIESRPLWKPLHEQPLFAHCSYYGQNIAGTLFQQGLCLPSGSDLTDTDLELIVRVIQKAIEK
ncbi:MAG: pyridoxal phosphate-dependent aminotransferase, partial [Cytophagales bacterium CG18_big_fil_WC_8_21_14_2_50_42_9]